MDTEIANTPMPDEYKDKMVTLLCNDCNKKSDAHFHIIGMKCNICGSYNTKQIR